MHHDGARCSAIVPRPSNRVIINNNNGVYSQGGADDVEVAYNKDVGLHMGHVVQIHQDGTPKQHDRVSVHDNLFQGINHGRHARPRSVRGLRMPARDRGSVNASACVYKGGTEPG